MCDYPEEIPDSAWAERLPSLTNDVLDETKGTLCLTVRDIHLSAGVENWEEIDRSYIEVLDGSVDG